MENILGFEPSEWFCQIARSLNPYVAFLSGGYFPPLPLAVPHAPYRCPEAALVA